MLDVDPKKRPTALELCKHPWFTNMDSLPNSKLSNIQDYNLVRVCQICFLKEQKKKTIDEFYFSIILMRHLMLLMQIQIKV
jgi:serine/threonine protein kinase